MEDALVQVLKFYHDSVAECLNPCFNGRCTRTIYYDSVFNSSFVVLILVLMEDALVLKINWRLQDTIFSLNPCFNGRCTRTGRLQACYYL